MRPSPIVLLVLQYFIPGLFSMLFRAYGLGSKSPRHTFWGIAFFSVISLCVPGALIWLFGYDASKIYFFFILQLANCGVFIITSDDFLKTCFLHFSQVTVVLWISTVAGSVRRLFGLSYLTADILRLVLSIAALVVGMRFCAKPMRFMAATIRTGWLGILGIPVCLIAACTSVSLYFGMLPSYPELLLIFVTTLCLLSFILYMYGLYHSLRESMQLAQERNMQTMLQAELKAQEETIAAAKCSRHDLRHHDAVLLEYLKSGETEEAIDYLKATDTQLTSTALRQFCKNSPANAVLRIYDRRAQAMGVPFAVHAEIPAEFPLAAPQIGTLLSNLLENALEASAKVATEPFVSFTAQQEETRWLLEVRNRTSGVVTFESGFPRSTKAVGGIGTKSVAAIVEEHGGLLRFKQEGEEFVAQVVLPL